MTNVLEVFPSLRLLFERGGRKDISRNDTAVSVTSVPGTIPEPTTKDTEVGVWHDNGPADVKGRPGLLRQEGGPPRRDVSLTLASLKMVIFFPLRLPF